MESQKPSRYLMAVTLLPMAMAVVWFPRNHWRVTICACFLFPDPHPCLSVLNPHWGWPSTASCPAPQCFQPPSNVCLASWQLAEQVLGLKAHLYAKLNRYRPLICALDWENSEQKLKKNKKREEIQMAGAAAPTTWFVCNMQGSPLPAS